MEEKPNYYSIIPAEVRYDNTLKDKAKLLYGEITSLSNEQGYCYASNKYFADLYKVSTRTITDLIKELMDRGYIESVLIYKDGTKEVIQRRLYLWKKTSIPIEENFYRGIEENFQDNNKDINNKNNNKENIKRKFEKPSIEEIQDYCKERNNGINANRFYDFYESKDWYVGKNKMKDWKACIRTWEQRQTPTNKKVIPEWFDKDIEKSNEIDQGDFKEFLEEFRNEKIH